MKFKNSQPYSQAAQTRKNRNKLLKYYKDIAAENRIRLSYKNVKRIDEAAANKGLIFAEAFEDFRQQKVRQKKHYIEKKYNLTAAQASEVYNLSIAEEKSYKYYAEETVRGEGLLSPRQTDSLSLFSLLDDLQNIKNINLTADAIGFMGFKGSRSDFYKNKPVMVWELEELFEDHYWKVADIWQVRYDAIEERATRADIKLVDNYLEMIEFYKAEWAANKKKKKKTARERKGEREE